jgi:sugar phosphate isomerase/epimerase
MTNACTRRRFLQGGITAAGLALPLSGAAAVRTSKMRFGFTTYQWGKDWDIPTIIANCTKAKAFACEVRTSAKYPHGVELSLSESGRREVKKQFADSPVTLIGIASGERFDWVEKEKLNAAIEAAKEHIKLSHDIGSKGVRVFPNDFHKGVPEEQTIEQIARAVNLLGRFAADFGQIVRLENHGSLGRSWKALRKIMDRVDQPNVRIMLNGTLFEGEDFASGFKSLQGFLADVLHCRALDSDAFPYQLQADLLIDMKWDGWWLVEESSVVPDRVQALIHQREVFEQMVAKSLRR